MAVSGLAACVVATGLGALGCANADAPASSVDDTSFGGQADHHHHHHGCSLVALTPSAGATNVAVVSDIRLTYSERLRSPPASIHVRELGRGDIAVRARLSNFDDETTLVITPEHSLHFWASYRVEVDGAIAHGGNVCADTVATFSTVVPSVPDRPLRPASINALARVGDGDVVLASVGGYRGFQILSSNDATLFGDLVTPVTPVAVAVVGERAFAAAGFDGVMELDVSLPETPSLAGRFDTPGVAQGLAPFTAGGRQYLAVADGLAGARIFDVTGTLAPVEVAVLPPRPDGAQVGAVQMIDGRLAAASNQRSNNDPSTVAVYDVSVPAQPVMLSETSRPRGISALVGAGTILYVGVGFFGIDAFDMADPAAPRLVTHVDGPHGPCGFSCQDPALTMTVDGGRLWVAMARSGAVAYAIDGAGGMALRNVVPVAGNTQAILGMGARVLVGAEEGPLVYDADAGPGAAPLSFDPRGHGVASSVAVSHDGFAYVAAAVRGVQTFDLTGHHRPLDQPIYLGQTPTPSTLGPFNSRTSTVLLDDDRILVGDARTGLAVLDRHDPRHPTLVGSAPAMDQVTALQRRDNLVFACDNNAGLVVYDVADSSAPAEVARATFIADPQESCNDLVLGDDVLFMAGSGHLAAVDVHEPRHPVVRVEVATPERAILWSIAAIDDGHLLALTARPDLAAPHGFASRLELFDVTDPFDPRWRWSSDELGGTGLADGLVVRGDIVFAAARDAGVWIFDVSRPDAPLAEGVVAMPGLARGVTPGDDRVYVAEAEGGLGVIVTGRLPRSHCRSHGGHETHDHRSRTCTLAK